MKPFNQLVYLDSLLMNNSNFTQMLGAALLPAGSRTVYIVKLLVSLSYTFPRISKHIWVTYCHVFNV